MARQCQMSLALFRGAGGDRYHIAAVDAAGEEVTAPQAGHVNVSTLLPDSRGRLAPTRGSFYSCAKPLAPKCVKCAPACDAAPKASDLCVVGIDMVLKVVLAAERLRAARPVAVVRSLPRVAEGMPSKARGFVKHPPTDDAREPGRHPASFNARWSQNAASEAQQTH